jgi:hypothetical protein
MPASARARDRRDRLLASRPVPADGQPVSSSRCWLCVSAVCFARANPSSGAREGCKVLVDRLRLSPRGQPGRLTGGVPEAVQRGRAVACAARPRSCSRSCLNYILYILGTQVYVDGRDKSGEKSLTRRTGPAGWPCKRGCCCRRAPLRVSRRQRATAPHRAGKGAKGRMTTRLPTSNCFAKVATLAPMHMSYLASPRCLVCVSHGQVSSLHASQAWTSLCNAALYLLRRNNSSHHQKIHDPKQRQATHRVMACRQNNGGKARDTHVALASS